MKVSSTLTVWLFLNVALVAAVEPISTSIAVGMAAALTGFLASYPNLFYHFHECCRPEWISFNKTRESYGVVCGNVRLAYNILERTEGAS